MLHYLKTSKTSLLNHSNVAVSLNGNIKNAQDKKRYLRTKFIVLDSQTIVNFFVICCSHFWFNSLEKLYDLQFWSPKKKTEQQKFVTTNCFGVFHVINVKWYYYKKNYVIRYSFWCTSNYKHFGNFIFEPTHHSEGIMSNDYFIE